jgi:hypothetical protein
VCANLASISDEREMFAPTITSLVLLDPAGAITGMTLATRTQSQTVLPVASAGSLSGANRKNVNFCKVSDLVMRCALEAAGVEFIEENGGGPSVRLRQPQPNKKCK